MTCRLGLTTDKLATDKLATQENTRQETSQRKKPRAGEKLTETGPPTEAGPLAAIRYTKRLPALAAPLFCGKTVASRKKRRWRRPPAA